MDIFGFLVREMIPPVTLAGSVFNNIALTKASLNFCRLLACTQVYKYAQI
jgi:hypothetical protein